MNSILMIGGNSIKNFINNNRALYNDYNLKLL